MLCNFYTNIIFVSDDTSTTSTESTKSVSEFSSDASLVITEKMSEEETKLEDVFDCKNYKNFYQPNLGIPKRFLQLSKPRCGEDVTSVTEEEVSNKQGHVQEQELSGFERVARGSLIFVTITFK